MESVDIAFTATPSSSRHAFDDRELIRAYDAALDEFHTHHPGPGTWLDKATAALAKGKALPGARSYGSSWYSAAADDLVSPVKAVVKDVRKAKRKLSEGAQSNPYMTDTRTVQSRCVTSPVYRPTSPSNHENEQQSLPSCSEQPIFIPNNSNTNAFVRNLSFDEAVAKAMEAQYTAGYWMGVVHAKGTGKEKLVVEDKLSTVRR